ncbi:protein plant cadmium resistance 8 [Phtheirospermum japonicum]|uniref:Protein plant cadmium resistance 8 n=1 Tax=Phtheirospermum japonicum TaxID=374723 RepID=A0A830B8D7_9LAMI|nr:protein plant cadmium resistance 8 [Phtheirospermum japonicum]
MTSELETRGGGAAAPAEGEEAERLLTEEVTVLDFDMLCATVAMQAQKGKWGKLNGDNNEEENIVSGYGGGLHRMWEGELVYDCFEDRRIALQSACCPCYRFGKNMKRAGLGSCFLQGSVHLILAVIALSNLVAFIITRRYYFLYLAISFALSVGIYQGYHRMRIRKKFNIKGGESSFDDCVFHLICPCCTLCQESRTLEMNNVQDGIWHGRGDTICIGSPPFVVSTKSPEFVSMQKTSTHIPSSVVEHSSPLVPPVD